MGIWAEVSASAWKLTLYEPSAYRREEDGSYILRFRGKWQMKMAEFIYDNLVAYGKDKWCLEFGVTAQRLVHGDEISRLILHDAKPAELDLDMYPEANLFPVDFKSVKLENLRQVKGKDDKTGATLKAMFTRFVYVPVDQKIDSSDDDYSLCDDNEGKAVKTVDKVGNLKTIPNFERKESQSMGTKGEPDWVMV
ncbi:MAG: hypothetical protein M1819_006175 [Sarea resinae]|nr:MAG: hypothetical protein M1819_006175 [Sarea resinae]